MGRRTLPFGLLIWVCYQLNVGVSTQERLNRAELMADFHWIQPHYGSQRILGEGVFLRGEPIELDVHLSNARDDVSAAAGVELDWFDRVVVRVAAGNPIDPWRPSGKIVSCVPLPAFRDEHLTTARATYLRLEWGGRITQRCRLPSNADDLAIGRNTVTLTWAETVNRTLFKDLDPNRPPRTLTFEYRDVTEPGDELDLLMHRAVRALEEDRLDDASKSVETLLRREPVSATGLFLRGKIHLLRGTCRAAKADWEQAAIIVANASDVLNKRLADVSTDPESRSALIDMWRRRADALTCR
jgi:hypothetical protein